MRDLNDYQNTYDQSPFEDSMVAIRRDFVLSFLEKYQAKRIIEIGCGNEPLFLYYADYEHFTIIEPTLKFYENAVNLAQKNPSITLHNDYTENCTASLIAANPDVILISGLLHEIPDPASVLKAVFEVCSPDTLVHINVPNANSFHRILALEMGLINDLKELSPNQKMLQQNHTFDIENLEKLCQSVGFQTVEAGSYFIKPFTHRQMQTLQEHNQFGEKVTKGLVKMEKYMKGLGAEIFINVKKNV